MIFPSGRFIYRGSHPEAFIAGGYINQSPNYLRANLPVYFSTNKNSVRSYGTAVKYRVMKNLNLLNMGNVEEVANLIEVANSEKIKTSIKKAFRITNGVVRRSSKLKYDIIVAVFICKLGYDGYYAPELRTKLPQGKFHPEVVLCNARKVLKVYNIKKMLNAPSEKVGVNKNIHKLVKSIFSIKNKTPSPTTTTTPPSKKTGRFSSPPSSSIRKKFNF